MAAPNTTSVVIIDDDRAVLDSFQFMLESAGYAVSAYDSAHSYMEAEGARGCCLILDHTMPEMTGVELAAALREQGRAIPILLVTAAPTPSLEKQASACGIERVLAKPPAEEDVMNFVAAHAATSARPSTSSI